MYFSEFFIFGFCYWVSMYNVCQPRFKANGILTDVGSCLGGVVAEAVVGEPRLRIEVLSLMEKGMKSTSQHRAYPPIDVQPSRLNTLSFFVIGLYGCTEGEGVRNTQRRIRAYGK